MKLTNKIVVITGASDGIGKQIALRLAKEKVKLALIARDEVKLKKVCSNAKKLGATQCKSYVCDLQKIDQLGKTVKSIISDLKTVDVLINNAGIWQKLNPIEKINSEIIDTVIQTNLTALIHTTKLFMPTLKKRPEAAIINISSKSGVVAQEGQSVYTASKYGVRGFTEVLKEDLKGSKIRVAGVYQSGTNTNMFRKTGDNFSTTGLTNPADLADVVAYMLSLPKQIWLHDVRVEY
ncbi:MAG: SDR family NAD(P)-dependent oxidoreductase [Candidatus Komeilibacteria bacterium]|nr:SDR family NAD(P)-dependent oxidoreductase [Candidatus Komeilibacteria bacterium]